VSNRYELASLLGAGGSARVHEARDLLLDRRVAIKLLDSDAAASNDPAGRDRFLREAQALARFEHPHAVSVYDTGDVDGDLFIVMELVEGTSLAHLIATSASMSELDVVRVGAQLLDALDAAHTAGLVHRDVKPSNILIDLCGDVKLADFGIAKRFDDLAASLTTAGSVIGTPQYLAPEQAAGHSATPQSDVYSTGVVLYEMLTGARPPASRGRGVVADVRNSRPGVSQWLATVVSHALAVHPEDRFATAADMASALRSGVPATSMAVSEPTQLSPHTSAENTPTQVISPDQRTAVWLASAASTTPTELQQVTPPMRPGRRRRVLLAAALVVLIAVIWFAVQESSTKLSISEPVATSSIPVATSTVPQTAPTTQPPPVELIPGFLATDNTQQFIDQLRTGQDVAGQQSTRLADSLQKLLDMEPERRPKDAEKLVRELGEWVEKAEIDPVVADAALKLLIDLGAGSAG